MTIYAVNTFSDDQGRRIEAYSEHGSLLPVFARFKGFGGYTVKTPQGPVQIPVQFEIPAKTLEEAFALYDETGKQAANDDIKGKQQNAIRRQLGGG